MLDFEIFYFIFLYLIFLPFYFFLVKEKRRWAIHSIFFLYLLGIISFTLFPIPIQATEELKLAGVELKHNFAPLKSIKEIIVSTHSMQATAIQIGGNLVLLLPFAFFTPLLREKIDSLWKVASLTFLFSLGIESSQMIISGLIKFNYKMFDVDDLILNTLGGLLGYGIFRLWKWSKK